jgi:hypothetical protein
VTALQQVNLWGDPARRAVRDDVLAASGDHQPPVRAEQVRLQAPV